MRKQHRWTAGAQPADVRHARAGGRGGRPGGHGRHAAGPQPGAALCCKSATEPTVRRDRHVARALSCRAVGRLHADVSVSHCSWHRLQTKPHLQNSLLRGKKVFLAACRWSGAWPARPAACPPSAPRLPPWRRSASSQVRSRTAAFSPSQMHQRSHASSASCRCRC
jgi:hypothetical protein